MPEGKDWPKLELVQGSQFCKWSILENKLKTLSENQFKLMEAIKLLHEKLDERL